MKSKIYVGTVSHTRIAPVQHSFSYPVYYYAFDLAELSELDKNHVLFGYNRLRPVSLFSKDYFGPATTSLLDKAKSFIGMYARDVTDVSSIKLVTGARYFNHVFNPVSFFYCYAADQSLSCILAYVNNTFSESHVYVLNRPLERGGATFTGYRIAKDFHVSPFFDREGYYKLYFKPLADTLNIHIALIKRKETVFTAQLVGSAQSFSSRNILKTIGRYPITASLTMPRIVWEAGKLYFQRSLTVYKKPVARSEFTIRTPAPTLFEKWCMKQITTFFAKKLPDDSLALHLPDRSRMILGAVHATPQYSVAVRDYRFFSRLLLSGDIGLGESYTNGEWDSDDIRGFMTLFIRHFVKFEKQPFSLSFLYYVYHRLMNIWRKNSTTGSRKNIQAHYDLSNELYRQFLDESMTYSCAIFESPDQSLADAQRNKLQKIIDKACIEPHHHVLEIGTGWGSFSIQAVRETGCRVTTVTISEAQYQLAKDRVAEAGLEDKIEVKLCDYRAVTGQYDRLVSIEMIEAVGHNYLPEYFKTCDRLLKPGGIMVLQVITIIDQLYNDYRLGFDWMRKHIFPGGHLPSLQAISTILTNDTRLMIENLENIRPHYIHTLARWEQNFMGAEQQVRALGFDEEFYRKWVFYFEYCQAAFATKYVHDLQLVLTRPTDLDPSPTVGQLSSE